MSLDLRTVAEEFSLSEHTLAQESLRTFLLAQLRLLQAECQARCAKFGVTSLQEMDNLLKQGNVTEEAILDDFKNVDYLTARIDRIKKLLEDL